MLSKYLLKELMNYIDEEFNIEIKYGETRGALMETKIYVEDYFLCPQLLEAAKCHVHVHALRFW